MAQPHSEPAAGGVAYCLYDVLGHVVTLLAYLGLPVLRGGRYREHLGERFGRVPTEARGLDRPLWIHAASVGEVLAAAPLVRAVRQHDPAVPIVVSTTSLTGRQTASEHLHADAVFLLPVDTPLFVARTLAAVRPRALVLVETELWPALLRAAVRRNVPCVLVSGRLSEAASVRYHRVRGFFRRVLSQLSFLGAQSEADAARLRDIGAPAERVVVLGNLKVARVAVPPVPRSSRLPLPTDRPILVAASTHAPEEDLVLDACTTLWSSVPEVLLVLAPRRPERFVAVAELLQQRGIPFERRTDGASKVSPTTRVLLLDTLGELADALPGAHAVYVGGTMTTIGGHNVLEPAVFAKPVGFGPDTRNVATQAVELIEAGAALRISTAADLAAFWGRALLEPEWARAAGAAGRGVVERNSAVAQRTLAALLPYLEHESAVEPTAHDA